MGNALKDMMRYTKLSSLSERRLFDPANVNDVLELTYYIKHNQWKDRCPFFVEYPWEDIPTMCKDKYVTYSLLGK